MSGGMRDLPGSARLWVFGADRPLEPAERETLIADLRAFVSQWTAHGAGLRAAVEWVEGRFAVIAVDESSAPASGCSIDALTHRLAALERSLACSLLDGTRIFYRDAAGAVQGCDRVTFRARAASGEIGTETPAFDPTIRTLADLRAGALERPVGRSWHRRLLPSPA